MGVGVGSVNGVRVGVGSVDGVGVGVGVGVAIYRANGTKSVRSRLSPRGSD